MAIGKDWLTEISTTLARESTLSSARVREVLEEFVRPDVLYMPVPRCSSCLRWNGPQRSADGREQCMEPSISPDQMDELMTLPDFGCVLWEAKDGERQ